MEFIDLKAQYQAYSQEIDAAMAAVLAHGQFIMGPEVARLEAALAAWTGRECIAVANGTDALELALRALDLAPGDEVITVPFTWISSAEIIPTVGARPVFADIRPDTYCLDPAAFERAITPRTRAVIPVSLFGQMYDVAAVAAIAERHGITVIEDGAQSFGATRNGQPSCGVTRVATTSFFPAKPFGCYGDGGAVFTADPALAARVRALRTHGGQQRHQHPWIGRNSRLDTLQAAVLLAKWPHFPTEVAQRAAIGARYSLRLSDLVDTPAIDGGNTHVYAQYTIRVPARDQVAATLKEQGIPTAVYYPRCLHEQPCFAGLGYRWGDFPVAEAVSREVLSLPMHPFLSSAEQDRVIEIIRQNLEQSE